MNIEDILPELFGEKRVYYCQRCLNHGLREKRKNHKQNCYYRYCPCDNCQMVERRRELNSRLMQMDGSSEGSSHGGEHQVESPSHSGAEDGGGKMKERRPNCQRCAQHNVVNRLKGHKRACPFKECFCAKCQVVVERQKLMADQIKLRRRQKREKTRILEREQSPVNNNNTSVDPVCLKCTQQAIGYQQLLCLFDPSTASDPLATLSAILQGCPHKENNNEE